jgi:hypothetical protein
MQTGLHNQEYDEAKRQKPGGYGEVQPMEHVVYMAQVVFGSTLCCLALPIECRR